MSQYVDGELPAPAACRVREHLAECPRCAEAVRRLMGLEQAIRGREAHPADVPDVSRRVTGELRLRGAFFKARLAGARRRVFGESRWLSGRPAMAVMAAVLLMVMAGAALDRATRDQWARQTGPVLADAERVLVRLVYVKRPDGTRLAWAQEESRKLSLPERLAAARSGAGRAEASELAPLETAFGVLSRGEALPDSLAEDLAAGRMLARAQRLRESIASGG